MAYLSSLILWNQTIVIVKSVICLSFIFNVLKIDQYYFYVHFGDYITGISITLRSTDTVNRCDILPNTQKFYSFLVCIGQKAKSWGRLWHWEETINIYCCILRNASCFDPFWVMEDLKECMWVTYGISTYLKTTGRINTVYS